MAPRRVLKRDGVRVEFDKERIVRAIARGASCTEEFDEVEARKIAESACHAIQKTKRFEDEISIEDIQDIVEFA